MTFFDQQIQQVSLAYLKIITYTGLQARVSLCARTGKSRSLAIKLQSLNLGIWHDYYAMIQQIQSNDLVQLYSLEVNFTFPFNLLLPL